MMLNRGNDAYNTGNSVNKYKELEAQYKAAIIDKYLELKMIKKYNCSEIAKELSISIDKLNQYKKDLGYRSERKTIHYTPEQRMEMSTKMKLVHRYRKEFKEQINQLEQIKNDISTDEYTQSINEIKNKYIQNMSFYKSSNNQNQSMENDMNTPNKNNRKKKVNRVVAGRISNITVNKAAESDKISMGELEKMFDEKTMVNKLPSNDMSKYEAMLNNV
jgi:hypothetical protein